MASLTDYFEDALRDMVFIATGPIYLALFITATTDAGGGTEVTGGSYARQIVTFTADGTGVAASTDPIEYTAMPAATVTHAALFDAATGGNMMLHGPLSAPKTVTGGGTLTFPTGFITATFT